MSVKKFKFVSPGVFTREVDNSQLPEADRDAGPVIIGRLPQGPAMEPVKINSFSDFVQVFGNPVPGKATGDVWRHGNRQGPTYASYAAQAYLRNSVDAVTVIRLAGLENEDATTAGAAGWGTVDLDTSAASNGGAYGLFLCNPSASVAPQTGYLSAIWYFHSGGAVGLSGTLAGDSSIESGIGVLLGTSSDVGSSTGPDYLAYIKDDSGDVKYQTTFNFDPSSRTFIRKVFNTNPQAIRGGVVPSTNFKRGEQYYWLGESYESFIQKKLETGELSTASYGLILPFDNNTKAFYREDAKKATTGWYFSQDVGTETGSYSADSMQKLFKIHALEPGKWIQDSLKISIQDLTYSRDTTGTHPYGTFSVVVRKASDTDASVESVERFSNCDLNPLSENYVSKKIQKTKQIKKILSQIIKYIRFRKRNA